MILTENLSKEFGQIKAVHEEPGLYFKVPILVNRYAIYVQDIEPKGFRLPVIDGFITRQTVTEVRQIIEDAEYRKAMVDHNYAIAQRYYGYTTLRRSLKTLMSNITGVQQ